MSRFEFRSKSQSQIKIGSPKQFSNSVADSRRFDALNLIWGFQSLVGWSRVVGLSELGTHDLEIVVGGGDKTAVTRDSRQ